MKKWLQYSLTSCFLYSIWAICLKFAAQSNIDTNTSTLIQLPIRVVVSLVTAGFSLPLESFLDLSLKGVLYTILATCSTVLAGIFYGDALTLGGSAVAVAAISGSYPALTYIICVAIGVEKIELYKVLGVFLAGGSCLCFALSNYPQLSKASPRCANETIARFYLLLLTH